jgi:hypothetical protein
MSKLTLINELYCIRIYTLLHYKTGEKIKQYPSKRECLFDVFHQENQRISRANRV